ncbi:MAG TPA: hypothetical protein V6C65_03980 [Allocoleopsis sp.]
MDTARDSVPVYLNQIGADTLPLYGIGDKVMTFLNSNEYEVLILGVYWSRQKWHYQVRLSTGSPDMPLLGKPEEELAPF